MARGPGGAKLCGANLRYARLHIQVSDGAAVGLVSHESPAWSPSILPPFSAHQLSAPVGSRPTRKRPFAISQVRRGRKTSFAQP